MESSQEVLQHAYKQAKDMAMYVMYSGIEVDPIHIKTVLDFNGENSNPSDAEITALLTARNALTAAIKPANPRAVSSKWKTNADGEIILAATQPIVTQMVYFGVFSLIVMIVCGAGSQIATAAGGVLEAGFFYHGWSWAQFQYVATIVAAAALGACFYNLYIMYEYITSFTFDPKYYSSYWIRIVLGIVAGFMLAEMIPIEFSKDTALSKPLLALVGGFSAEAVNWILKRFVETVKTLVKGSNAAMVKQQEKLIEQSLIVKQHQKNIEHAKALGEAQRLLDVANNPNNKAAGEAIDQLIARLLKSTE